MQMTRNCILITFRQGNDLEEAAAITAMGSCIAVISQWMHSDKLKLNSDKTECLLVGKQQQLQKVRTSVPYRSGTPKLFHLVKFET